MKRITILLISFFVIFSSISCASNKSSFVRIQYSDGEHNNLYFTMKDDSELREIFNKYNELLFNNELEVRSIGYIKYPLKWSAAFYETRVLEDTGEVRHSIVLNSRYKNRLEERVIHEMIHLYQSMYSMGDTEFEESIEEPLFSYDNELHDDDFKQECWRVYNKTGIVVF